MFPLTFINDPMFTFGLADALFLEATDVVFLDELFFLKMQQYAFVLICRVIIILFLQAVFQSNSIFDTMC